jgi:hypothetical protein
LIGAYTDGGENRSILTGDQLLQIAQSSQSVLHVVSPTRIPYVVKTDRPCFQGYRVETNAAPAPRCDGPPMLERAVLATGGRIHTGDELAGPFKRILRDFLYGYVLYFEPTEVTPGGWHDLSVSLNHRPGVTIHARREDVAAR